MVMMTFLFLIIFHLLLFVYSFSQTPMVLEMELSSFLTIPFSFIIVIDWISLNFSAFVMFISAIIVLYSEYYMNGDNFMMKFISLLVLFVLSMLLLIFGGNFFMIMIGWDGLGLVSFLLVVYYSNKESMGSGILTIMMNRLGDVLILLSIFYFSMMKGFDLDLLSFNLIGCLLLMISFLTKSAQFPFSSWLPAAMAAPTPISALVHSSTLVTAGIYLSIRFNFLFSHLKILTMLMTLSLITMMLGGILANTEMDFKKIVAMSTLSQLGLLFFLISLGFIKMAFFHMISHAFFKSLLFMGTGVVILSGSQDSRYKGLSTPWSFLLYSTMTVSLFSLMAVPFSVGFYSKDLALDFMFNENLNMIFYFLFLYGSLMTVKYSMRMLSIMSSKVSGESFMTSNFSMFLFYSMILSISLTMFWGKLVYGMIMMEDFILMSFPIKTVGLLLILISLKLYMFKFMKLFNSLMAWFKYMIKNLWFFDYLNKSDQLWTENISIYLIKNTLLVTNNLESFDKKMGWMIFWLLWMMMFILMSLSHL
uniref:NADH:ubiquinone reductase (H(+)-translocating) n=1 Tax=Ascoschoengastia sp. TATW-1 TaxID=436354 RepID=B3IUM9_9ACAR|nr:NADH dehydrogenase subunit 5 [Ascoschoengastia sp. TATW-1]